MGDWTLPIESAKNTEGKMSFRSGAPVWCRRKTLRRENKYLCSEKGECLCVVFLVIIRSDPLLDGEVGVSLPAWVVGEDEDNEDSRNCTISES